MAITISTISIQLVAGGSATSVVLKVPSSKNRITRGQALLSHEGQTNGTPRIRRPDGPASSAGLPACRARCHHSPITGSGQTVHQIRPPSGTSRMIRADSHSTQMIIGPALRPATFVPNSPARMMNQKTPSIGSVRLN